RQHGIIDGFDGAGHKQTAGIAQFTQRIGVLEQVFDLDRDVIAELGKFAMHRLNDSHGVRGPVEEVWIAKGNMLSACLNLLTDILEHDVSLHNAEDSVVDRDNRAMPAEVFASAAGLRIAGDSEAAFGHEQMRVLPKRRKMVAIRENELHAVEGNCRIAWL